MSSPKETYASKLKNPKWQKLRLNVFERDKFTCILCKDDTTELHVHHTLYKGEPWEAPIETLKTVCKTCHMFLEKMYTFTNNKDIFPERAEVHVTDFGDGNTSIDKMSFKWKDTCVVVYSTGHVEYIEGKDVKIYYHLIFES